MCGLGLGVGRAPMLGVLGRVRFSSVPGFGITLLYPFLSLCHPSRYLQSSSVWIHEPWQKLMSSL